MKKKSNLNFLNSNKWERNFLNLNTKKNLNRRKKTTTSKLILKSKKILSIKIKNLFLYSPLNVFSLTSFYFLFYATKDIFFAAVSNNNNDDEYFQKKNIYVKLYIYI